MWLTLINAVIDTTFNYSTQPSYLYFLLLEQCVFGGGKAVASRNGGCVTHNVCDQSEMFVIRNKYSKQNSKQQFVALGQTFYCRDWKYGQRNEKDERGTGVLGWRIKNENNQRGGWCCNSWLDGGSGWERSWERVIKEGMRRFGGDLTELKNKKTKKRKCDFLVQMKLKSDVTGRGIKTDTSRECETKIFEWLRKRNKEIESEECF